MINVDLVLKVIKTPQCVSFLAVEFRIRKIAVGLNTKTELFQIVHRLVSGATAVALLDDPQEVIQFLDRRLFIEPIRSVNGLPRQVVAGGVRHEFRVQIVGEIHRPTRLCHRNAELGIGSLTDDLGSRNGEFFSKHARRIGQRTTERSTPDDLNRKREAGHTRLGQRDQLNRLTIPRCCHCTSRLIFDKHGQQLRGGGQFQGEELSRTIFDRIDGLGTIGPVAADNGGQVSNIDGSGRTRRLRKCLQSPL